MMRLLPLILVLLGIAVLDPTPAAAGKRVGMTIGNDLYQSLKPLQKAVNDARAVKGALEELGFEVIAGENLTRREMNRRLSDLERTIAPGDTVFFFYAGHGVAIGAENYLLPVDVPLPQGGEEGLVRNEGHAADAIIRAIQAKGAATTFVVLDACRNNPIAKKGTREMGLARGLARIDAPTGVFVLFSAGIGQTALDRLSESDSEPNSVFTRKLVPLLTKSGLSHVDLAKELQQEVSSLAATIKHRQEPAYYDQIIGKIVLRQIAVPADPAGVALGMPSQSEAERAWTRIEGTQDRGLLEAFVQQFPDTIYAALARRRLDDLPKEKREKSATRPALAVPPQKPSSRPGDKGAKRVSRNGCTWTAAECSWARKNFANDKSAWAWYQRCCVGN